MDSPTRGLAGLDFSPYLQDDARRIAQGMGAAILRRFYPGKRPPPPYDDLPPYDGPSPTPGEEPSSGLGVGPGPAEPGAYPLPEPPPDIPLDVAEDIIAAQLAAGFELGRKAADEVLRDAAAGKCIGLVHVPGGLLRQPFMAAFDARMAEDWAEVLEKQRAAAKAEAEAVADFASDLDPAPAAVVKRERTPVAESEPAALVRGQRNFDAAFAAEGLSSTDLLVLLSAIWLLRGRGSGDVGAAEVAEHSKVSERSVRRSFGNLVQMGLLSIRRNGPFASTLTLHLTR